MRSFLFGVTALLSSSLVFAQNSSTSSSDPTTPYTITADSITATFIGHGARLVSLLVPDRNGDDQEVVVGYNDTAQYLVDSRTNHTYFGPVVGRYANRIKNGTFTLDGQTYHIPTNENGGLDTLHGGTVGYDQRNWTVLTHNQSSVSFAFLDTGYEGFPGTVLTVATYSVSSEATGPQGELRPRLTTQLVSTALDQPTPIMLSNHIYWNLNAFKQQTILNDTYLWLPQADRWIEADNIEVPTGVIGLVANETALDFTSPKTIGQGVSESAGQNLCGFNCTGIDNAFIIDRSPWVSQTSVVPVLHLWSETTGIQMDVSTNQQGLQIYTCNGQNGTIPVNAAQVERNGNSSSAAQYVNKYGCIVIEPQAWIAGINYPEWGVQNFEIFSPSTGPAINYATYDFSSF